MQKSGINLTRVCLLALTALLTRAALAQDFQGTWQGSIPVPDEHLDRPYVFQITKDAKNHWAAGVSIDEDWGAVWKADSVSVDGRGIKFTVTSLGSTYDGQLSEDGNSMTGLWSLGNRLVPLRMVRPTSSTRWRETPHKTIFVTVERNIRVEVLDWGGTGRPIVMLPGAGLTAHLFSKFVAKLTPIYHVYGITPRGFGASSAPAAPQPVFSVVAPNTYELKPIRNNPYDANRLGDDVIKVLNTLHIQRPVLVGHSIAGEYLTSVASRYPTRVAGLIYLDAFYGYAFSDGQSYDSLFTDKHPMRMTVPPGQTPLPMPNVALLLGMHEYRHFPAVPALVIFALHQGQSPGDTARIDRTKVLPPAVHIVRLRNADHMVWESNEADVLREMNAFIANLSK